MQYLLLQVFAFLRPILSVDVPFRIGGLSIVELGGILLFGTLLLAFLYHAAVDQNVRFSVVDAFIFAFVFWCIAAYVVHFEESDIKSVVRLIFPPLTYTIAKNAMDKRGYERILALLILGFAVSLIANTAVILSGGGLDRVSYWTKVARYKGIFENTHNMGHSMSLFLVLATFYFSFRVLAKTAQPRREGGTWFGLLVLGLCGLAIFGSLMAAVRTAVFGLIVFWLGYGFFVYRKMLVAMLLVVAVATPLFGEKLVPVFFGDFERVAEGKWGAEELGSGRPRIWAGKLNAFAELPLDRQLAGIGVGARMAEMGVTSDSTRWLDSHNDFLEMLVELGAIGFVLTIALYCALLRQILTLTGWQKALFLSFFVSVVLMNFLSNSYISRFAIGQVFFLLMAYIELREPVQREHTQQRVGDDARS